MESVLKQIEKPIFKCVYNFHIANMKNMKKSGKQNKNR